MDDPALFMPHLEFTQNLGLTRPRRALPRPGQSATLQHGKCWLFSSACFFLPFSTACCSRGRSFPGIAASSFALGQMRRLRRFFPDNVRPFDGRVGEMTLPCPAGARRRCKCAYSTLFAPAGRRRFRVGAPDFGVSRRKGVCGAVCPSRAVWQARREAENGAAPPHSRRVPANVATAFAYPAQTAPPGPLFPLAIPRGERRALPAPAQGINPHR